jgi:hypothetical protein
MVGLSPEEGLEMAKRPSPNPYEIITPQALKMYGLKVSTRIDIPTTDPMKLAKVADALEELAGRLRRLQAMAVAQPAHMILLGAVSDIRQAHQKIKAISKAGM